jgi:hypothetical protein
MATTVARNRDQGKTQFAREVLQKNPHANAKAVNEAWALAGRDGSISETLVNKQRSEMGLAGNLRGGRPRRTATAEGEKPRYTGKKRGRKPKSARASAAAGPDNGRAVVEPRSKTGGRHNQLVALEAEIDRLLFKVMHLGELPEIEDGLRRTRRLLYEALSAGRA